MTIQRAYSLLNFKSLSDEKRTLSGVATTPTPDRVRDVVEPAGMIQRAPINLYLHHKHFLPVGHVEFGRPTKTGIPFEASIPDVAEQGVVRERVNEAWHSVKYRLLQAVSIGFAPIEDQIERLKSGGLRFLKWEMLELSLVGVPANPDALVNAFKSMDSMRIRSELGISPTSIPLVRATKSLNGAIPLIRP